ncbi:MAG: hypothetical protein EBW44_01130 [Rhodobacteraceae bacterium]|nr:hypothetical protein [Paracoccaceae bacterium]NCV66768.1 hypothetical protein [Paracoccaceae bacterium]
MSLKKDELVALLDAQSGGGSGEGSGIKPSTPLAGQEDLANRTLDWKYQAPAQDSADAAPSAAPEFVAAPDPEPAAEPAPAPKPEPASAAPSASASQEAGDMSGTTKLLIAVAVIVVLYWIIF